MVGRISHAIGTLLTALMLARPGLAQQPDSAIMDASYGPHGYGTWGKLTQHLGGPSQLGLWLDKERYDTLDVSAGGFVYIAPEGAKPGGTVELTIRGNSGEPVRQAALPADRGCIAFDLRLRGLAPAQYVLTAQLAALGKGRVSRSVQFRVVASPRPRLDRKRVRITVENPSAGRAFREPVYAGLPIPKGELWDARNVRVVAADGKELPAQVKPRTRWDRHGSIRWLGIWFTLEHAAGAGATPVFVEYGPQIEAGARTAAAVRATKTDHGWIVTNGPLRAHLDQTTGRAIEKVHYDANSDGRFADDELAFDGTEGGPYLVDDSGQRFVAVADMEPSVVIEENGPECFVMRTESWCVGKAPPAFHTDPGLCKQITRVKITRGTPRLDVSYTWINTARSFEARYTDIGLSGRVPGANRVVFGTEDGSFGESVTSQSEFSVLQDRWNRYGIWMKYRQEGHQIPSERSAWKRRTVTEGAHAPGWGALLNDRIGVAIGCEDFWQNYPKEISTSGEALTFHVWPAHNQDHERQLTDGDLNRLYFVHEAKVLNFLIPGEVINFPHQNWHTAKYYLHFSGESDAIGLAKTHELKLCFFPADREPDELSREMQATLRPTIASVAPHAVIDSGVLGPIGVHDPKRFPEIERQLEKTFKCEIRLQELDRDYGMFIFGGGHSGYNLNERRFNVYRGWRNTHHTAPRTPWLFYLRSADPFYFRCGLRNARKVMDLGFCHHSRPELDALPYGPGKKKGALCDYKGLVPWHSGSRNPDYNSMTDFLLYFTYLTGSNRGREVAQEWWECAQAFASPPGSSRTASGTLAALLELYQDTWDRRMLPMIHATYHNQCKGQNAEWGDFNEWQNYAPWLERYWSFTGSEHAKTVLVKWADAFLRGWGDVSNMWGHYLNIPAYAFFATEDPKYVRHLKGVLWQEARSSYDDPHSPLDGLWRAGHVSLGHYYMQRALYAMEAIRRAKGDPGVGETRWAIHPNVAASPPEHFVDVWVLDEKDEPIKMLVIGTFRDPRYQITVRAPDGKAVIDTPFKARVNQVHGSYRPAVSCYQTIPPDGQVGVYKVRIESLSKTYFNLHVPMAEKCKEVYACRQNTVGLRSGRAYFEVPKDSGKYVVDLTMQKGGPFPSWLFDEDQRPITSGTLEVRSDGIIKRGFPVTVDSSRCHRYMVMSNRATYSAFTITGKSPPKCVAASWKRLFDPEKEGGQK